METMELCFMCIVAVTSVIVAVAYNAPLAQRSVASAENQWRVTGVVPSQQVVFAKYCIICHNQRAKIGGLALDTLDLVDVPNHVEDWEKVVRKVCTGVMLPVGRPRPDKATADSLVTWLEGELDRAVAEYANSGRLTLQRFNRSEYSNAVWDLLAVELDAVSLLLADVAGYGFDNNADALMLFAALTERYLGAAAKIGQMVLGRPRGLPTPETFFVPSDSNQGLRISDDLLFGSRGGVAVRYHFPADGEYFFEMRPRELGVAGGFEGVTEESHQLYVSFDKSQVWTGTIGGSEFACVRGGGVGGAYGDADRDRKVADSLRFSIRVKAGLRLVQVYFAAKTFSYQEDLFDRSFHREPYRKLNGQSNLSIVTIIGPQSGTMVVSDSLSRRKVLICTSRFHASVFSAWQVDDEEVACAKTIISTLARRAYRRSLIDEDLQVFFVSYRDGAKRGGFEAGIEMAIRSIFVSSDFLFCLESQPTGAAPNTFYRFADLDLASRLSFFIWSSISDDEFVELAEKNNLHKFEVLRQQVRRMLADPRSSALVDNFAGQWFHVCNVAGHQPSPEVFFRYDDNLRKVLEQETKLLFESIIRENRSVIDLLNVDYIFLNEWFAKYYGIGGIVGERFRCVLLLFDSLRRGFLGQGSILMATSYPNRTSLVIRGKWILENIFGAPLLSSPLNVFELKDECDPRKVLSMREQMVAHRANPVCAGCYAQMDQLGFALENFDGIGEWWNIYVSGSRVDASAVLSDGIKFNGFAELRQVLLKHSDEFLTTMTEKLLTYALGRGLEVSDALAVRKIKCDAAGDKYRFESLVSGIVISIPFQMKMAHVRTNQKRMEVVRW